jgi:hypothetical protein
VPNPFEIQNLTATEGVRFLACIKAFRNEWKKKFIQEEAVRRL